MSLLPSRFLRITSSKNQLVKRLERLRTSKVERQEQGHVLVQGIKTLEELTSKGHHFRTIGITFDERNLPIRSPALDIVRSVQLYEADQFVALSQNLTSKVLGTDSLTSEHEVWAEVATRDYEPLRLLVLDQISDPGNLGLIIRSAMALSWDAAWHTFGTVDPYNDKVVRASRALCLDWPTKTGSWTELESVLEGHGLTLMVADMIPSRIMDHGLSVMSQDGGTGSLLGEHSRRVNPCQLVWWNWPASIPQHEIPERIALVMSSEHHAKERLLRKAIRVSIPMNSAVESMNVAAAATTMMWELNRVMDERKAIGRPILQVF
ncbi:Alpha/beta knot methyltransferase [Mortierella sp. GBAus27b]|nr:Alpha/beta knot methyltransferase [Mortierella sp. GBAus27b]